MYHCDTGFNYTNWLLLLCLLPSSDDSIIIWQSYSDIRPCKNLLSHLCLPVSITSDTIPSDVCVSLVTTTVRYLSIDHHFQLSPTDPCTMSIGRTEWQMNQIEVYGHNINVSIYYLDQCYWLKMALSRDLYQQISWMVGQWGLWITP